MNAIAKTHTNKRTNKEEEENICTIEKNSSRKIDNVYHFKYIYV